MKKTASARRVRVLGGAIAALVMTWHVGAASARQVDQPDAAKMYVVIWQTMDQGLWEAVTELRQTRVWVGDTPAEQKLAANEETVLRVMDATRITPCVMLPDEFGQAQESKWLRGWLSTRNLRWTMNLLDADSRRLLAEGDADGSAARVAALVRLAGQMAQQPRPQATTMAASAIQMVEEQIRRLSESGLLSGIGRREITVAVMRLNEADPAGFSGGIRDQSVVVQWAGEEFTGTDAGERLVESLPIPDYLKRPAAWGDAEQQQRADRVWARNERRGGRDRNATTMSTPSRDLVEELRKMDGAAVKDAVEKFEKMMQQGLAAWGQEGAEEAMEQLDSAVERNEHGALARLLPVQWSRQLRNAHRVAATMDRIRLSLVAR